jgi:hypothetical protein
MSERGQRREQGTKRSRNDSLDDVMDVQEVFQPPVLKKMGMTRFRQRESRS